MVPEPNFHPEGVRRLARAVIVQASREAVGAGYLTREEQEDGLTRETLQERALHFLRSAADGEEEAHWFGLAEVDSEDVLEAVLGRLKNNSSGGGWFGRHSRQARN